MSEQPRHARTRRSLKRLSRGLWTWTWRTVAFGLILAAVLLTVARLLLPFASEYRAEIEQRVESYLGTEISIGELDIGWQGLVPRLVLTDVVVEAEEGIAFERAYVSLWPAWEETPTLEVSDVSLLGLELSLQIDERGRLHVLGMVLDPQDLLVPEVMDTRIAAMFDVSRLQLLDTTLELTGPEGAVSHWRNVELRLANAGDRHRLSLVLTPPGDWGESLRGLIEFEGDPSDYRDWRARLFAEGKALSLSRWSELLPNAPWGFDDGRLDVTAWSDWNDGRLIDAQTRIGLDAPELTSANEQATVGFERLDANLRLWRPSSSQWQLDADGLRVRRDGGEWSGDGFSLAREDSGAWRLAADFLRLDDLVALAPLLPLDEDIRTRVAELEPRGDVHGLSLAIGPDGGQRLRAGFRELGWSADGRVPGMDGLDGHARLGADGGIVELESSDVAFRGPHLFREPLRLQELSARVRVENGDDGLVLDAPRVRARNEDLRGRGRARVELERGESPLLDLHFVYQDGVATATPAYLPAGIMPPEVVSWLDQAFRDGRVERGSFLLRGRADEFPFREHTGMFDVRFDVADVTLHYADDWPEIEELGARVHFAGAGLDIRVDDGAVNGARLRGGRARFADLAKGLLEVDADAIGPLAAMLDALNRSPLAPEFEPVFGGADAAGETALALSLSIPVNDVEATRVDGEVRFIDAALAQPRHDLAFGNLDGSVHFSERSVDIDGLQATLRGRPVRIDARTEDGIAVFRGTGELAPLELLPVLADGALADSEGRSGWEVTLRVPLTADDPARLEARSDLRGTRIGLPPPLAKPRGEARPLRLEVPLTARGAGEARVRYGDDTHLVLEFEGGDEPRLRRLGVGFNRSAELPPTRGIRVAGELPRLPLADWIELAGDGTGAADLSLVELDLRLDAASFDAHQLSQVTLAGGRAADGWRFDIASNEATGSVEWPFGTAGGDPVRARFEWVDLALLAAGEEDGNGETADYGRLAEPENLPPIDLHIDRLKLARVTLSDFVVVTGTGGAGRSIHRLDFHTDHLRARGQGLWRGGQDPRTQLRMNLQSEDFGRGLADFGYPGVMAAGDGGVTFDLEWPGPPWDPAVADLAGHAEFDIENGVLQQVNPGAARLLGMFSLETVPFRTLLQEGLIFSRMRARVDLDDGNAYTGNLRIDSAVGRIRVRGRTGLSARDYDLLVRVRPELSTSLPMIGFLSGGPAAAAAVALLQGVMRNLGQDIERASEVEYAVTGPWDEPEVVRVDAEQAESDTDSPTGSRSRR